MARRVARLIVSGGGPVMYSTCTIAARRTDRVSSKEEGSDFSSECMKHEFTVTIVIMSVFCFTSKTLISEKTP